MQYFYGFVLTGPLLLADFSNDTLLILHCIIVLLINPVADRA